MTKSELIEILASRHNQLAPKDAELAVKTMLDAMSSTLSHGDRVEIRGFGSFGLNFRPPRTGRNPKTGEKVLVPKKYVPHFKAGKELRERVDEALEAAETAAAAAREQTNSESSPPAGQGILAARAGTTNS
ncbi:MAG: integration host factor subunit beta [Burkholderiales bacterium]|nr:integration host factor subunit beta [Rhodocyclaceae bacterium]